MANYVNRINSDGNIYNLADTEARDNIADIQQALMQKVDKVEGKGLSSNDLTYDLKFAYDSAVEHSKKDHARADATSVKNSTVNGNIIIDEAEINVYTHPEGTNPHGTTKEDLGLDKVENFKAVSTDRNQGLTQAEQENARENIGAGTSSFSGNYADLIGKPDALLASDVYPWAKEETKPEYTAAEVGLGNVGNFKAVSVEAGQGLTNVEMDNARSNINAQVAGNYAEAGHTHTVSGITDFPTKMPASDVYDWAKAATKPTYDASEVGLGNVGNFKAVSVETVQGLTETEKETARLNIGVQVAGDYAAGVHTHAMDEITDLPDLGTACTKDIAVTGDASADQVVLGSDSRLTNARPASDVSAWAKAATKPEYTAAEIGLGNVGNFKSVSVETVQSLSDDEKTTARSNINAQVAGNYADAGHTHEISGITDFPTLGTASAKDVASSGDASATQVVLGNDSRLTDARKASDVYDWAKAATKPEYTATEVGAITSTMKGAANGVAELDSTGKVPASQLPSYVDDVVEGYLNGGKFYEDSTFSIEITAVSGKIYVDLASSKTYRWTGSTYTVISETIALGETSSTAYRGDRGAEAYTHAQSAHAPVDAEKNQNAFSNVKVGTTTVSADSATDTVTFAAGDNVTIIADANSDTVTISAKDTVYNHPATHAATMITGLANVATSGKYSDLSGTPTIPTKTSELTNDSGFKTTDTNTTYTIGVEEGKIILTGSDGNTSEAEYKCTTSLNDLGVTATATELNVLDGITATTTELNYCDGVTSNIQNQLDGKAATSHGTHVTFSTTAPTAAGTASAGSASTVSRSDHIHPEQTSVSGNAGSATKLETARTIRTNLGSTSTASFDGTANATPGVTGTLALGNGGTGATTASEARTNLGLANTITIAFADEDPNYNVTL